jgi:hypothetical protein
MVVTTLAVGQLGRPLASSPVPPGRPSSSGPPPARHRRACAGGAVDRRRRQAARRLGDRDVGDRCAPGGTPVASTSRGERHRLGGAGAATTRWPRREREAGAPRPEPCAAAPGCAHRRVPRSRIRRSRAGRYGRACVAVRAQPPGFGPEGSAATVGSGRAGLCFMLRVSTSAAQPRTEDDRHHALGASRSRRRAPPTCPGGARACRTSTRSSAAVERARARHRRSPGQRRGPPSCARPRSSRADDIPFARNGEARRRPRHLPRHHSGEARASAPSRPALAAAGSARGQDLPPLGDRTESPHPASCGPSSRPRGGRRDHEQGAGGRGRHARRCEGQASALRA